MRSAVYLNTNVFCHPRTAALSDRAFRVWIESIHYIARHPASEGVITARHATRATPAVIRDLETSGLWEPAGEKAWHVVAIDNLWRVRRVDYREPILPTVRYSVYTRDAYTCQRCRADFRERAGDLTLDHIKPWSRGGSDRIDNLQAMCRPCNSSKGAREIQDGPA